MITTPKIRMLQLKPAGSGFGVAGKNMKTQATERKQSAMMLMGVPALPSVQREGGNGSPRRRFVRTQAMQTT